MRKLAYIETIKSLTPIPNADSIECATILGWEVVVKRGDFKVGDKVIYCEIDSVLPELPPFEFLRQKKFRIKTVKLRGQVSQGIIFPISTIKEVTPEFPILSLKVGDDVTGALKITKYDPEAELDVAAPDQKKSWIANKYSFLKWKLFGIKPKTKKDSFPEDCPKTDETRVQNMGRLLYEQAGKPVYITEKCEGTSTTYVHRRTSHWLSWLLGDGSVFQACSRNQIVYDSRNGGDTTHHSVRMAEKYNIAEKLKKLNRNLCVQGEIIGPKVQGNIYKLPELEFRAFLIFDLDNKCYVSYDEFISLTKELELLTVPILDTQATVQNSIKYYVELSKGKSKINPSVLREGIVIRSLTENFSFKSINPDYLLGQKD